MAAGSPVLGLAGRSAVPNRLAARARRKWGGGSSALGTLRVRHYDAFLANKEMFTYGKGGGRQLSRTPMLSLSTPRQLESALSFYY